ncbi:dipeptidase [Xenococcus sp. PCC 7305]|uniref:dipeptidase n=1 Tax=Xenococcus sp. PCC 7305 TaxID=102125 RepID=UPI0002F009A8|nr:dipeptidase [Xenococcus sp. PCC 7305]
MTELSLLGCTPERSLSAKPTEIHDRILTVDGHIDWPIRQFLNPEFNPSIRNEPGLADSGQWDLVRMEEGGLDAVFMAIFTVQRERNSEANQQAKAHANQLIDLTEKLVADNQDQVEIALRPEDAYRNEKLGKKSIFLGMENAYPLGTDLENVQFFFDRGIRYITLTHTKNNDLADSSTDEQQEWGGLSPLGAEVVREMNRLGIMIDVSHVHDDTFWDVIELTKAPIIASHSSARALRDVPRNMNDDLLRAIKKNGGVVQLCFLGDFIKEMEQTPERQAALESLSAELAAWSQGTLSPEESKALFAKYREINQQYPENKPTLADVIDHLDHMVEIMGIDHVGIGSDFDGGGGLIGINDVSEMPNITQELLARGYSESDIRKIWGGNLLRVFEEVIAVSSNK